MQNEWDFCSICCYWDNQDEASRQKCAQNKLMYTPSEKKKLNIILHDSPVYMLFKH